MNNYEILDCLETLKKNGPDIVNEWEITRIVDFLKIADQIYYNAGLIYSKEIRDLFQKLISDSFYDHMKKILEIKDENNQYLQEIGAKILISDKNASQRMVTLPFSMASLDKIKRNTATVWLKKIKTVLVSDKLDGISLGIEKNNNTISLFTRGDGVIGQDVTNIFPKIKNLQELKTCKLNNIQIRGELVIKNDVFKEKYSKDFSNSRNLIAGMINRKMTSSFFEDVDFIGYSVIYPNTKPVNTFHFLKNIGIDTPFFKIINDPTTEMLENILKQRKIDSPYMIDGIVVTDVNQTDVNSLKNPKNTKAFKMLIDKNIKETVVEDVEWNIGKTKVITPRIRITPVIIDNVKITHITGHNAKNMIDNSIGVGARIQVTRSGDVIPYLCDVLSPAIDPSTILPQNIPFVWDGVYIKLDEKSKDVCSKSLKQFEIKKILPFLKTLEIKNISTKILEKLFDAGYDNIFKICEMTEVDFLKIQGFKKTLASKIYNEIQTKIKNIFIYEALYISGCFSRTMGIKRLKLISDTIPNFLELSNSILEVEIYKIPGFEKKTISDFISGLKEFKVFLKKINKISNIKKNTIDKVEHDKFLNKNFVFTGFRDANLEKFIISNGGKISNTVSSKTSYVLTKNKNNSKKVETAKSLCIEIIDVEDFKKENNVE